MDDMHLEQARRRVADMTSDQAIDLYKRLVLPTSQGGAMQLVAYVRKAPDTPLSAGELVQALSESLPGTHVPRVIHVLDQFPRSAGGKVDRDALSRLAPVASEPVAPISRTEDPLQRWVQAVWAEVLNVKLNDLDERSNFFALGGTSLGGLAVSSRLSRVWDDEVPLLWLLRASTLGDYVSAVRSAFVRRVDFEDICTTAAEVYGMGADA